MCPKTPDLHLKKNVVVEGSQYNTKEEDRSFNILNVHSHKQAITAGYLIIAVIVIFCLFLLYKKLEARAIARAEQRSNERSATAAVTVEQLVAEIRGRREERERPVEA